MTRRAIGALSADRADPAGMGIDQRRADRRARQQAERCRALRREAVAERRAGLGNLAADLLANRRPGDRQADAFEILRLQRRSWAR